MFDDRVCPVRRLLTGALAGAGLLLVIPPAVAAGWLLERALRRVPSVPPGLVEEVATAVEQREWARRVEANKRELDRMLGLDGWPSPSRLLLDWRSDQ